MGFGSSSASNDVRTGFCSNTTRSGTTPASDWARYPDALRAVVSRMRGVIAEQTDALATLVRYDYPDAVFYLDPPYLPETRSAACGKADTGFHAYRHELNELGHRTLLQAVLKLRGMALISGYASSLYEDALNGWQRFERPSYADGAQPRTEVLWISPNAQAAKGGYLPFRPQVAAELVQAFAEAW